MNKDVEEYLQTQIRQNYMTFDRCHDHRHFDEVYEASKMLVNVAYHNDEIKELISLTAAAYHDLGRMVNDEEHEKYSSIMFSRDLLYKELITDIYGKDVYDGILYKICTVINCHRSIRTTEDEMCLILKDADKVSHTNKERGIYRPCAFYIDRLWKGEPLEKMIDNRFEFMKGSIRFEAKSEACKLLYGEDKRYIPVSREEIKHTLEYIQTEVR